MHFSDVKFKFPLRENPLFGQIFGEKYFSTVPAKKNIISSRKRSNTKKFAQYIS